MYSTCNHVMYKTLQYIRGLLCNGISRILPRHSSKGNSIALNAKSRLHLNDLGNVSLKKQQLSFRWFYAELIWVMNVWARSAASVENSCWWLSFCVGIQGDPYHPRSAGKTVQMDTVEMIEEFKECCWTVQGPRSFLSNAVTPGTLQLGKLVRQQGSQSSIFQSKSEYSLFRLSNFSVWAARLFISNHCWLNKAEHPRARPTA